MSKPERMFVYSSLLLLALLVLRAPWSGLPAHAAAAGAAARPEPPVARIGTCDVYAVMQKLVESDRYKPARNAEQERARVELKEIAEQIRTLESDLKNTDPKAERAMELFREYNTKKEVFAERQREIDEFLGNQFVEAYEEVLKAADTIGQRDGYTHVLASRRRGEKISTNMDQITQQVLSRPALRAPAEDDLTDRVMAELKL